MRRLVLLAVGCVVSVLALSAQQPVRDVTPAPLVGTARLAGQVLAAGTEPRPLRRVIVTAIADGMKVGRSTITDDQGRFAFDGLTEGRFTVTGTKAAYLPGAYGAAQSGRPGVPIQLGAGESRTDVSFTMMKGAVIAGAIRSATGEPVANVDVSAFRLPPPGSDPRLVMSAVAVTDDRGVYRMFDLAPGAYVVAGALKRRGVAVGDAVAWTSAQITEQLKELEQRETRNAAAAVPPLKAPPASEGTYAWAPVYFPGAASADAAVPIRVRAGEERGGIDFTVELTRLATIDGQLIGPDAGTAAVFFNVVGLQMPALMGNTPSFSSQVNPGGRAFKYTGVTPGHYTITAQSRTGTTWAQSDVIVTGDDVDGITLALQPAMRMSGRMTFQGNRLPRPDDLSVVTLRASQANGMGQSSAGSTRMGNPLIAPAVVTAEGRFEFDKLLPGTYRLMATIGGNPGWWLRSAIVDGRDLLDTMVEVSGDMAEVVVTFSDQHASLSGRLITNAGPPAAPYFIVVFPPDRTLWLPQARRIISTRADTSGRWVIRDLPPGDYLVAALTDLAPNELADATFLEQLLSNAVKVTVNDGENKTQDLRIGG